MRRQKKTVAFLKNCRILQKATVVENRLLCIGKFISSGEAQIFIFSATRRLEGWGRVKYFYFFQTKVGTLNIALHWCLGIRQCEYTPSALDKFF